MGNVFNWCKIFWWLIELNAGRALFVEHHANSMQISQPRTGESGMKSKNGNTANQRKAGRSPVCVQHATKHLAHLILQQGNTTNIKISSIYNFMIFHFYVFIRNFFAPYNNIMEIIHCVSFFFYCITLLKIMLHRNCTIHSSFFFANRFNDRLQSMKPN